MKDFYSIITQKGLETLAQAKIDGINVNLTHFAAGDGNGTYYTPNENQTGLVNELYRGAINRIYIDPNYPTQIVIEASIAETVGDFFIREIGILDENGNWFAFGKYPVTYKPLSEMGSGKDLYIRMVLAFSSSPNVNLYINPHSTLVSIDQIENLALNDLANVADEHKNHQQWPGLQGGHENERYHVTAAQNQIISNLEMLQAEINSGKCIVLNSSGNGFESQKFPSTQEFLNALSKKADSGLGNVDLLTLLLRIGILGADNYWKIPVIYANNQVKYLLIQVGSIQLNADTDVYVTFPVPFTESVKYFNWMQLAAYNIRGIGTMTVSELSTTGMRLGNGQDAVGPAYWIAIGY